MESCYTYIEDNIPANYVTMVLENWDDVKLREAVIDEYYNFLMDDYHFMEKCWKKVLCDHLFEKTYRYEKTIFNYLIGYDVRNNQECCISIPEILTTYYWWQEIDIDDCNAMLHVYLALINKWLIEDGIFEKEIKQYIKDALFNFRVNYLEGKYEIY